MWNLLQWRASQTPGLERANLRLGEVAVLTTKLGVTSVEVVSPDGKMAIQSVPDKTINLKAEAVGIYEIRAGADKYAFSSNALYQAESDLTDKATGRWGDWAGTTLRWWGLRSFAWFFLLLAIGILTLHMTRLNVKCKIHIAIIDAVGLGTSTYGGKKMKIFH